MAMHNSSDSSGVLWERAKELLRKEDYERLKTTIKTFSKTRSLEGMCSDLLKIVNSRSKVDILTEVRKCLPKDQRNKFTRHCNELLKSEAAYERADLEKKRKNIERKELDRENLAANFQGSPAKKTKQNSEKPPSSRSEKNNLQGSNQLVCVDGSKESQTLAKKGRTFADRPVKPTLDLRGEEYKTVVLERKFLNQEFGFKVRGGTFHQPAVTVAQVAKDSPADGQGLKTGDRIIRVNDQRCGRGAADIAQVIEIIKAAKTIHMRIVSGGFPSKDECNFHGKRSKLAGAGAEAEGTEQKRLSMVSVYPNEDGWLGCCIRGGTDYACDVHVISVDNCSSAERAGVKAGDVIMEVNGASTKDLTHVQVVRLVVTSGPCVTFSLKSGSKQRRHSSRREPVGVQPTPLRTQHRGFHDVTPPRSPTLRRFHLPGYPHKRHRVAVDSPSQLHMDVMRLDYMPPPPYTPEVPSRHRLLAKGGEGHELQESPHQEEMQVTHCQKEAQGNPNQIEALDIPKHEEPQKVTYQQLQQDNPYQGEPQEYHYQEVSMEVNNERQPLNTTYSLYPAISDGNEAGFEENMASALQDGNITGQDYTPTPAMNAIPQEEKISEEKEEALISGTTREILTGNEALISGTTREILTGNENLISGTTIEILTEKEAFISGTGNNSSPLSTSQSPEPRNGRESFLSQIRQFNKAKLKKQATCPEFNSSEWLQSISTESNCTSDELQWVEDGKESIRYNDEKENLDATNLLSVLNRVMKNRARSLHDTLSSADEGDSSNDDDDEWEL